MIQLSATFVWGLLLLLSFVGWGNAVRALLRTESGASWGEAAVLGLATTVCAGGALNLVGVISRPTVLGWVGLGVVAAFVFHTRKLRDQRRSRQKSGKALGPNKLTAPAYWLIALLALVFYCGTLAAYGTDAFSGGMNGHDDFQAYLVFPHQMLQTGSMLDDPFNERRMASSLGGQAFLHTLVLAVLPDESLKVIDPGIPFLITVGLVVNFMRRRSTSWVSVFVPLLVVFGARYAIVNLTSVVTSMALFVGMPLLVLRWTRPDTPVQNGCLVGLLCAGTAALKSTNIPFVGFFFALVYGWRLVHEPRRDAIGLEIGVACATAAILLAPGMVSMYQTSGTALYPLLGTGHVGSGLQLVPRERTFESLLGTFFRSPDIIALLALGIFNTYTLPARSRDRLLSTSIWLAACVSALVLHQVFQGHHPRYHFPAVTAAIIVSTMYAVGSTWLRRSGVTLVVLCTLGAYAPDPAYQFLPQWHQLRAALADEEQLADRRPAYRRLQNAAPPEARLLVRLKSPFALDFRRNPIWTVDLPCGVGAPPGMPCHERVETIVAYLRQHDVEYVAYSYRNSAGYSRKQFSDYLTETDPLIRGQAQRVFRFNDVLREIGHCYPRVFDDGWRWLVRLDGRSCP
jgi:hypothetical protein